MAAKLLEPVPPGEMLYEEFMKPLGVSINALAREIAVRTALATSSTASARSRRIRR